MNKADIIQQWKEDQKEVDPWEFGWIGGESSQQLMVINWKLNEYTLTFYKRSEHYVVELEQMCSILFDGKIANQGELRVLMKMLNIE